MRLFFFFPLLLLLVVPCDSKLTRCNIYESHEKDGKIESESEQVVDERCRGACRLLITSTSDNRYTLKLDCDDDIMTTANDDSESKIGECAPREIGTGKILCICVTDFCFAKEMSRAVVEKGKRGDVSASLESFWKSLPAPAPPVKKPKCYKYMGFIDEQGKNHYGQPAFSKENTKIDDREDEGCVCGMEFRMPNEDKYKWLVHVITGCFKPAKTEETMKGKCGTKKDVVGRVMAYCQCTTDLCFTPEIIVDKMRQFNSTGGEVTMPEEDRKAAIAEGNAGSAPGSVGGGQQPVVDSHGPMVFSTSSGLFAAALLLAVFAQ